MAFKPLNDKYDASIARSALERNPYVQYIPPIRKVDPGDFRSIQAKAYFAVKEWINAFALQYDSDTNTTYKDFATLKETSFLFAALVGELAEFFGNDDETFEEMAYFRYRGKPTAYKSITRLKREMEQLRTDANNVFEGLKGLYGDVLYDPPAHIEKILAELSDFQEYAENRLKTLNSKRIKIHSHCPVYCSTNLHKSRQFYLCLRISVLLYGFLSIKKTEAAFYLFPLTHNLSILNIEPDEERDLRAAQSEKEPTEAAKILNREMTRIDKKNGTGKVKKDCVAFYKKIVSNLPDSMKTQEISEFLRSYK